MKLYMNTVGPKEICSSVCRPLRKDINMTKKKTLLAACAALLLGGCFKTKITVNVNKDGTANGTMQLLVTETMLTMDGTPLEDAIEEMAEEYRAEYPDATVEVIQEGEPGSRYGGVQVNTMTIENAVITKEGNTIRVEIPIEQLQDEIESETSEESDDEDETASQTSISMLKQYGAEATLIVNMPAKAETNVGTVNGNQVTLDLLETYDTDRLIITCRVSPSPLLFVGIGAGVLAVIAVILILKNKKTV